MKKALSFILALLLAAGLFPPPRARARTDGFRAVWVASILNLDYPSKPGLNASALKREADVLLDNARDMGFNAVILQVRPSGDALYASSVFPWSDVVSGEQGKAPDGGFDPLAYFTEGAHSRGMELHAWINPFRIARNAKDTSGLSAANPAKLNPSWAVAHTDGHLYYDPGIPEARQTVLDGVREIVENYDVDGIHYDDYFYPGSDFADGGTYQTHGSGFADKDSWRRGNIDALISGTKEIVHTKKDCRFGVAPQAIWANKSRNPLGSDTKGYETYYEQFADSRKWVLEGWVDYVAPQIYWEIGREGSDYAKVLAWWADLVSGTGTDLYVGHATYLMNGGSSRAAWKDTSEIARQLAENGRYTAVKGDIHFRYALIAGDKAIAAAVKAMHNETVQTAVIPAIDIVMPQPPSGKLAVGRPNKDVTFSGEHYYFAGASDPNQKLTVNGTEITNRTLKGYFSYYASLKKGANTFTFKQGDQTVARTVTVPSSPAAAADPPKMQAAAIEPGVFPDIYDELRPPGAEVTLYCTAPIGAAVTVRVGGMTLAMTPATTKKPSGGGLYATKYTAKYTYPSFPPGGNAVNLGTPVYTMTYDGVTSSRAATGALKLVASYSRVIAEVISGGAFAYPGATTTGGPSGELSGGQLDAVASLKDGAWVELGCGLWIPRSSVCLRVSDAGLKARINGAEYLSGERWDTLTVKTDVHAATTAVWDGQKLIFTVFCADGAPNASLPSGAAAKKLEASFSGGKAVYALTPGEAIDGYYTEPVPEGLRFYIKRKPRAKAGDKPLDGFTIVIDAGHGGDEPGAYGPLGAEFPEKHINLYAALKLRQALSSMGAKTVLTRSDDDTVSLQNRLDISRSYRPDLFISLHCNSMGEDVDSDKIRGVTLFYREALSETLAKNLYDGTQAALGVEGRGCRASNLYVLRGFWTPSVLFEMAFLNNPFDYEWLTDDAEQNRLISAVADEIVAYFR